MTYDDLPILGRAPAQENLWLATGHGMMGMTLSAITGQLLAELITGAPPSAVIWPACWKRSGPR